MGSVLGSLVAGVGLLLAGAVLLALLVASGLTGRPMAGTQVLVATCGFLAGVFTFGYGMGKRTAGRI